MRVLRESSKCSGCSACFAACPKSAIKMSSDEEGFLIPVIDEEKCIDCGICIKVCPVEQIEMNMKKSIGGGVD